MTHLPIRADAELTRSNERRRVALVTGGSSGIGKAIVDRLTADGLEVYGTSRNLPAGAPPGNALQLDVTSDASVTSCVAELLRRGQRIDVLVNNAGYLQSGAVEEVTLEQARAQFETNFFGALRMVRAVLPVMRAQGSGRIVTISSLAGLVPLPFWGLYDASKFALEGLSEALREEVRPFGIHVSLIEPGAIRTPLYAADYAHGVMPEYAARRERFERTMKRFELKAPAPDLVAGAVSRAVRAKRPALRYRVTKEATLFSFLRTWLPEAWFHAGLRASFHLDEKHA